jgi:adenylosuccinate lyase
VIDRYTLADMGRVWSQQATYETWLRVEIAVAEAWSELGRVPASALAAMREGSVDARRIETIEKETRHDINAFLQQVAESVGPDSRWIHLGLTSSDVKDTGLALQLRDSLDLLDLDLNALIEVVRSVAVRHRRTVMAGRTHNVHAEPTTFGFKALGWYEELRRHRTRLHAVRQEVCVAKISGAVGTHAGVPPEVEERVACTLGLGVESVSTQVVSRDRHASYVLELALLASTLDKIATELRSLQHTEILEVEEPFRAGQHGSSAMPHKRNPILNERISGLARVMRGYAVPALENVVLWHERDMSNSSEERIVLPGASALADFMLTQMTAIFRDMQVHEQRMQENLERTRGLIFSERVLTALVEAGLSRQDAYHIVQSAAMRSWETGRPFKDLLSADERVTAHLSERELEGAFDPAPFMAHIETAYRRAGIDPDDGDERPD